jgi:hypothetical protein
MIKLIGGFIMYYQCYDEAVKVGLNAYSRLEYSDSCCSAFRVAAREFKEYMEYSGLSFSTELSKQWINNNKENSQSQRIKKSDERIGRYHGTWWCNYESAK